MAGEVAAAEEEEEEEEEMAEVEAGYLLSKEFL